MTDWLDTAAKIVALALGIGGVIYGAVKLIAVLASGDGSLKTTITSGFKALNDRLDRIDKDREEERRARVLFEADLRQKELDAAIKRAQSEEREKNLTSAVREIRDQVADLQRETASDHEDVVQRLTNVEGRIGGVERRLSGQMGAVK